MMTVQHVKVTEAMIGMREPDLVRFPEVDVLGKEYKRGEVSMRNIGPHQFVVIPSALEGADKWEFEMSSTQGGSVSSFQFDAPEEPPKGKK